MKSRSARAIGGLVGFLLSLLVIGGYTLWLFQQAPSSRDVLVSSWLLAWPVCLIAISLGMLVAAVFRSKRTNP